MALVQDTTEIFNPLLEITTYAITNSTKESSDLCITPEGIGWLTEYQPVYMWIIFVLGFIENLIVICVYLLHKSRSTVAEIYLANLAAADLLLVCSLPIWALTISNSFTWVFGSFLCVVVNAQAQINMYASIYFLLMVSIDRFLALVKTMSSGRMRGTGCAKLNCLIIWIFAVLMSIPKVAFRVVTYVEQFNTTMCLTNAGPEWHVASNFQLNIVGFLIPIIGIAYCTLQIMNVLRNNSMQKFKEFNTEKKATVLIFTVLLLFIVCWLPFHIFTFLDTLDILEVFPKCALSNFFEIGNQISTYIAYSNSCINPLLYVLVGNHFRKKTMEVYRQLTSRRHRERNFSIPTDFSADTIRTSISMGTQNRIF
ncbi:B2 bradykinin receptor-like [Pelobates fuscus]|uniref:B2 bradykinin receptor-like n=1 Tax=Pelobates fuscus TaxID=191477 RepID=UPI002FE4CB50